MNRSVSPMHLGEIEGGRSVGLWQATLIAVGLRNRPEKLRRAQTHIGSPDVCQQEPE